MFRVTKADIERELDEFQDYMDDLGFDGRKWHIQSGNNAKGQAWSLLNPADQELINLGTNTRTVYYQFRAMNRLLWFLVRQEKGL